MNNYPVVLAHGIARFDFLTQRFSKDLSVLGLKFGLAANELNYFKGIARHLRSNGIDVYQSSVSFAANVEKRAADLKREVETALALRPGQPKVHIIAHSMGGLDARHMIVKNGMAGKVASVTTIGTPHWGTSFADWGIENAGHEVVEIMGNIFDLGGFADLTTAACREFNAASEAAEAANDVVYQVYAADEIQKQVFGLIQPAWEIIAQREGENDGLVPRSSQLWAPELSDGNGRNKEIKQMRFAVSADHLNEIGWWDANQLQIPDLLHTDLFTIVRNYENSIKNVYLEIARNMQQLD